MRNDGPFTRLLSEFGGSAEETKAERDAAEEEAIEAPTSNLSRKDIIRLTRKHMGKAAGTGKLEVRFEISNGSF